VPSSGASAGPPSLHNVEPGQYAYRRHGWTPQAVSDLFTGTYAGRLQDFKPAPLDLGGF